MTPNPNVFSDYIQTHSEGTSRSGVSREKRERLHENGRRAEIKEHLGVPPFMKIKTTKTKSHTKGTVALEENKYYL